MPARIYPSLILYTLPMRFRLMVVGLLSLALFGCGGGDSREVLLRLKPKPGDTYTLDFTTQTKMHQPEEPGKAPATSEEGTMTLTEQYTFKSAGKDGQTWETKNLVADGSGGGQVGSQIYQLLQARKGKIQKLLKDDRNRTTKMVSSTPTDIEFPIEAVHVGDAWRSDFQYQGYKMTATYTVQGFEKVDGVDTIVITAEFEGRGEIQLARPMKAYYDIATGFPVKGDIDIVMSPSAGSTFETISHFKRK